jgi:hypothetical protein
MTAPPDFGALQRAVELLSGPHPYVLACLRRGDQPYDAIPGADPAVVGEAVRRLMELGVVREDDASYPTATRPLALTPKGQEVARLVEELWEPSLDHDD